MRHTAAIVLLFLLSSAIHALVPQNLVDNPNFDAGTAGWTLSPDPGAGIHSAWQAVDAIGSSHSGSLLATAPGQMDNPIAMASQCLPLVAIPGASYTLSVRARHRNAPASSEVVATAFFTGANCTGTFNVIPVFYLYVGSTPDNTWVSLETTSNLPTSGFASVQLYLVGISVLGTQTRTEIDDVYFGPAAPASCVSSSGTLCINDAPGDARFRIFGGYSTTQGGGSAGAIQALALSSLGVAHGGLMWFFAADNPELLVKVLNGCSITGHYWVFISAGTNVSLDLYVEDTHTGAVAPYHGPDVSPFPAVQDLYALPCG